MKEIRIPFEKFKFDEFIEVMDNFADTVTDYDYQVPWVYNSGEVPNYNEECLERDFLFELKEEGKLLFFYFTNVNIDEPIECADGNEYELDDNQNFWMGMTDAIGYLLGVKDGVLTINSAMNAGGACPAPPPAIDIKSNCNIFDKPMENFIKRFID